MKKESTPSGVRQELRLHPEVVAAVRRESRKRKESVNRTVGEILARSLGVEEWELPDRRGRPRED